VNKKYSLSMRVVSLMVALAACQATINPPASIPTELSIEEHALTHRPEAEYTRLDFVTGTQEQILAKHSGERSQTIDFMDRSCSVDNHYGQCMTLGSDQLAAWADDTSNPLDSISVTVRRNGRQIYRIPVGNNSPISSLRGLWTYAGHWVLETAYVTNHQEGNEIDSQASGQISVDGKLLNEQSDYQEAFGFQTMHGKPFYFFKQKAEIGIVYNNVTIPLDYSEIPHYACCSAAALNPQVAQNMVAFFARKASTWYYVEIGVFR
jgi:hypothetical protein